MLGLSMSAGLSGPLYRVDQVPEHFHEHYILRGYRHPKSSVTQCLLSLFDATNETLNFWTHFLPSWYFIYVLVHLSRSYDFLNDSFTWPLLCYLVVTCAFPLMSSIAHLFNVMSDHARHVCFFLDYASLSLFSFAVAVAYRAYCFPSGLLVKDGVAGWLRSRYVDVAAVNAILCTLVSSETRFMKPSPIRKALRLGSFAFPYIFDSVPIIYRLLYCTEEESQLNAQYLHFRQFMFAFLAAFLYASHFPERLVPGTFDIVGHSHQLFHVASILGTMDQLQAILWDIKERKAVSELHLDFDLLSNSIGYLIMVLIMNALIVLLFTIRLFRLKHKLRSS